MSETTASLPPLCTALVSFHMHAQAQSRSKYSLEIKTNIICFCSLRAHILSSPPPHLPHEDEEVLLGVGHPAGPEERPALGGADGGAGSREQQAQSRPLQLFSHLPQKLSEGATCNHTTTLITARWGCVLVSYSDVFTHILCSALKFRYM